MPSELIIYFIICTPDTSSLLESNRCQRIPSAWQPPPEVLDFVQTGGLD